MLTIFASAESFGQTTEILWEHSYGGTNVDFSQAIHQTADSGFIVVGYSGSIDGDISSLIGLYDYWILKLDDLGNLQWEKSLGGTNYDFCYDIALTDDSGYIAVGGSYSTDIDITDPHGGLDYWVIKLNSTGEIEWQKSIGGAASDEARSVLPTSDGGYLVVGTSSSNDGDVSNHHGDVSNFDIWIAKLSSAGDIQWENSYGSFGDDYGRRAIELTDGNFVIIGSAGDNSGDVETLSGIRDYWILKIDSVGNIVWSKTYGGTTEDDPFTILQTPDAGFLIGGETTSNDGFVSGFHGGYNDAWIIKIDSSGNFLWQKCYGGDDVDKCLSLTYSSSNNYVFAGYSQSSNDDLTENKGIADVWIVSIDTLGSIVSQKSIGGSQRDISCAIIGANDSNFVMTGYSNSNDFDVSENQGDYDYWIVKLGICNTRYFTDSDGDGYGDLLIDSISCNIPIGFVIDSTDCDDTNSNIYPGAPEILNGLDDDCDELVDENLEISEALLQSIKIYPSPTEDILHVEYSGNEKISIELVNITGQILFADKITSSTKEINVSAFASGLYILRIYAGEEEAAMTFVKK